MADCGRKGVETELVQLAILRKTSEGRSRRSLALTGEGVKDLQVHRIIARQIRETNLAHDFHINYENLSLENR
jgi:hypothetical protein